MSFSLSEEIAFSSFLDDWAGHVLWRTESDVAVEISTEASLSKWAGVIHRQPTIDIVLADFQEGHMASESINV